LKIASRESSRGLGERLLRHKRPLQYRLAHRSSRKRVPAPLPEPQDHPALVTSILGWGGAVAFALAASYLIRLAIDTGWLTPVRQVAFAAIAGLVLIGTGFALRNFDRQYAGLLPAGGIAILFLSIYGGHLY
jgi:hypothetical protein